MTRACRHRIITEDLEEVFLCDEDWQRFAGKRVLVAGATSFLAAYLVEFFALLSERWPERPVVIYALARDRSKLEQRFAHLLGQDWFRPIIQDVIAPLPVFEQVDYIINAAGAASPKYFLADPLGTIRSNVLGNMNLLDLAREHRARVLYMSSGAVYGTGDSDKPIGETDFGSLDPLDLSACYGESKRLAETLCAEYHRQYGVHTLIARISHTYGPGVALDDGRSFADFIAAAVQGRDIVLNSDGSGTRPFCYVGDVTAAFLILLLRGEAGQAYNVGMDEQVSILELARLVASLAPVAGLQVYHKPPNPGRQALFRASGHFDLSKMLQLGWRPSTDLESGFSRTLRYFTS